MTINILETLIGSALGATAAGAALIALFRELILKRFDAHLKMLSGMATAQLELQKQAAQVNLQSELAIYPALGELLYRSKLLCDSLSQAETRLDLINPDLREASRELTTKLVGYRLYLPPEVFDQAHAFKRCIQDLLITIDVLTRPDSPDSFTSHLPAEAKALIGEQCDAVRDMCNRLIPIMGARMKKLGGDLNP